MSDIRNRYHDCGCFDEYAGDRVFSLSNPQPMPERSDFTDNCTFIRHYCEQHWEERSGKPARPASPTADNFVIVSMVAGGTEVEVRFHKDTDVQLLKMLLLKLCESNITVVDGAVHIEETQC